MLGKILGHFRIVERLGEGGMGEVYLAEDIRLRRHAAVKILRPSRDVNERARARFQREAEAAARLNHPNIVTIYDIGEHEGIPYIAMEYVDGVSLDSYVRVREGSILEACRLVLGIARGLEKAHAAGIVHRDLKPTNVLVDSDQRPRILDFGVAQVTQSERLTQSGQTVGTLAYMSPEQLEGDSVDHRTDIWSLGVILYELLARRRPFMGDRLAALMYEILHADPFSLSRLNPGVSPDLNRIVTHCLAKNPDARYHSMSELSADLTGIIDRMAESAPQGQKFPSRKTTIIRWGILAAVAALIIFAGLLGRSSFVKRAGPSQTLVVLPFENLGAPEQEYFADGLTDELSTRMGRLAGLRVISHASAMTYKGQTKTSRTIGEELGAGYILEGTVRWQTGGSSQRVRITPRLVQAKDNHQAWSETYDRDMADVFAIQTDIAEKVARSLDVFLFAEDRRRLQTHPTSDLRAYDYYLQAQSFFNASFNRDDTERAIALYARAVEIDSTFVSAWARQSVAHSRMYWFGHDQTSQRLALAEHAVRRAAAIDSLSPDVHIAFGYLHYWGRRDYERALAEFIAAQKGVPNSAEVSEAIGYVLRRQGRFDSSIVQIANASRIDPRSHRTVFELGNTYYRLRRWPEADSLFRMAIALSPTWTLPYSRRAHLCVYASADLKAARAVLTSAASHIAPEALAEDWVWLEGLAGNLDAAMRWCDPIKDAEQRQLEYGRLLALKGDSALARVHFDTARAALEEIVKNEPQNAMMRRYLGDAYSGLGQYEEAAAQIEESLRLLPVEQDAFFGGPSVIEGAAQIYAASNRPAEATAHLARLLQIPAGLLTPEYLEIAPEYLPLRGHSEFAALLQQKTP